MRRNNTDYYGRNFTREIAEAVWIKGTVVPGYNPAQWRKDACGAWMRKDLYGDTASPQGWEIDHIKPVAAGGPDDLANLQPLQWENNRRKADNFPNWSCAVRAA